jgi:hypothetical protein
MISVPGETDRSTFLFRTLHRNEEGRSQLAWQMEHIGCATCFS